jgi:hypothetical protein
MMAMLNQVRRKGEGKDGGEGGVAPRAAGGPAFIPSPRSHAR